MRRTWGSFTEPTLEFTSATSPATEPVADEVVGEPEVEVVPEAEVVPETVVVPEAEPVADEPVADEVGTEPETRATPVEPVDDLVQLFEPRGRLLSRAFESGGPQRSVLTELADSDE